MTKEELEKEAEKHADGIYHYKINVSDYGEDGIINYRYSDIKEAYIKGAKPREKRIAELEEKISVLLSCKNCPENKGGLICAKEYENKCLAQKIEFIKELQEENAELKEQNSHLYNDLTMTEAENAELKEELKNWKNEWQEQVQKANDEGYARTLQTIQLSKAKELLNEFMRISKASDEDFEHDYSELIAETEQFIKNSEVKK